MKLLVAAMLGSIAIAGDADAAWRHMDTESPMGDGTMVIACTTSLNKVSQKWPYHDEFADLCVRYKPDAKKKNYKRYDVIVHLLGPGQILCGLEDCEVRVRLDDKKADTVMASEAMDQSSNNIFLSPGAGWVFAYQIDHSQKAAIELTLYQNGTQAVVFDTAGLKLSDFERESHQTKSVPSRR
jgi:hypothetical protein